MTLQGKKILLAVTGSIAAYKSAVLLRLLIREGAEVKVVMTPAAHDFITPLTLSTLSKNPVITGLFAEGSWSNHVMLGRWADLMVIAPLSCNTLAKMANGFCDNMLLATYLSATCPVAIAPAMDEDMWHHFTTKTNLKKLQDAGVTVFPAEYGELASGLTGEGRMSEPENIVKMITDHFFLSRDLEGRKVLITAGPTYEPIDPVRFIGNHSSGKMGIAISEEMARRGAEVELVLGPSSEKVTNRSIKVHKVETAMQMYETCVAEFKDADIAVMSAAVADYTPSLQQHEKIKKTNDSLTLELTRTHDILGTLGEHKKNGQLLVGFSLETNNEKEFAKGKLKSKNADLIVLNSLRDEGAGFGHDTNKITIFEKNGTEMSYERKPKQQVAKDIVDRIVKLLHA
jgi:phosphopantothenoylcysteine decarboxylase / phosphopantothenate---cysteine ligase